MSTTNQQNSAPKGSFKPNTNTTRQEIVTASQRLHIQDRPEWIDCRRVKSLFTISRSTVYRLAEEGKIKTVSLKERGNIRGKRLFSYDSLSQWLNSRATGGEESNNQAL